MTDSISIEPIALFQATLTPPGSKSLTNRALLLAALGDGASVIDRALGADDTLRMIEALGALGFEVERDDQSGAIRVVGRGGQVPNEGAALHLGNAGTAYRFLTAACCLGKGRFVLDGVPRMRQRPIGQLVDALGQLGAVIKYEGADGFPPVCINGGGGLRGGELKMPPTVSSQYISALLQVGPYCQGGLSLCFDGPVTSRPYVAMTIGLMGRFGVEVQVDDGWTRVDVPAGCYRAARYAVEPDASAASYFLAAAAVVGGSRCTIEGLGKGSLQGDVGFADLLEQMGASLLFGRDFITVMAPSDGRPLRGIDVDLNHMPDTALTLAAIAPFAKGRTAIRNIGNLRIKETDRLAALVNELSKLGADAAVEGDDLLIDPPADGRIRPAAIDTYDDHRMAMSFAVVGLAAAGIVIKDPGCVNKSFPGFFDEVAKLGRTF